MKRNCPDSECLSKNPAPKTRPIVRKGRFYRASDGQWIQRYLCGTCRKTFSSATGVACYRQKKRKLNCVIDRLFSSCVSQRRAAILLRINRKTAVRKFRFLAEQGRLAHEAWLRELAERPLAPVTHVQFDDLETSEHTKCKPLSVVLAVEPQTRKILGFRVSRMPAKGHLASLARKKYGYRPDERLRGWNALFLSLKGVVREDAEWLSDENPHYPAPLKFHYPQVVHQTVKGRRGCIAGQGELKKIGWDPLFSLNHTCAMLRANLNRLVRKTWCTTKNLKGLMDHLWIYIRYHNEVLTSACTI